MNKKQWYLLFLSILFGALCPNLSGQTTLKQASGGWTLMVDGNPFEIKGVTFGYQKEVENYDRYFKDLQFLGVNTIRTWATDKNTGKLLDTAQKHGIKVMLGIWMRHGRPGMEDDDRFDYLNDSLGKEEMFNKAIATVARYKNHPAVLTWGVGNEVYLNTATAAEKEAYSILLERICGKIKMLDTNHPITSVEAWTFGLDWWQKYVPSVDIYGLNSYGPGAEFLASELQKKNINQPYIVTEFGVTGEWDIKANKNGIKREPSDTEKHQAISLGYPKWIKNKPNCLGAYVFHYGNGTDFGSVWLNTHYNFMLRPQYWAIREAYTGQKPVNNVPLIETFQLPEANNKSQTWIPVTLKINDIENEELEVGFYFNQRSGSRKRRNQILPLDYKGNPTDGFQIKIPSENGALKIYVMVNDTYNNLGIASTSILAEDKKAGERKYLVPKVSLPFYVYKNNQKSPYIPSAYMGNYKAIEVDLDHKMKTPTGNTVIKITYNSSSDWYGVGFVDPANDWGHILGGYDISGAKTFSFWAKANDNNIKATIGFGLIGKDKPYPDTAKKAIDVVLTKNWKKYTIKTKRLDLSCIRSGLVLFSNSRGFAHEIYLSGVVFE